MDEQLPDQMPSCSTWDELMSACRLGVGEEAMDAKVMLVELKDADQSYLAFTVAGDHRVFVAEHLLRSLDRLFEAVQQQNALRRAQEGKTAKSALIVPE